MDVAKVARAAVDAGADLLGMAGGDGTQALVAGVAAERRHPVPGDQRGHAQPFRPRPGPGPRGPVHLPERSFRRRRTAGRPRGDQRPDVRQQRVVRRVRGGRRNPRLPRRQAEYHPEHAPRAVQVTAERGCASSGRHPDQAPHALLVADNPYGTGDIAGLGRRARLDRGALGVVGVTLASAPRPPACPAEAATGLSVLTTRQIESSPTRSGCRSAWTASRYRWRRLSPARSLPGRSASGYRVTALESRRRSRRRTGPGRGTSPA